MLFISRRFPSQKTSKSIFGEDLIYGVADSDDGVGLAQFARHFHLVKTFITIESPSMVISLLHLT